jgi:hypothetical protein
MKLFRFIKNVWTKITEDISFKDAFKMWMIIFSSACLFLLPAYIIGKTALFFGLGKFVDNDPFAAGAVVITALLIISAILRVMYVAFVNLKKIWKNS